MFRVMRHGTHEKQLSNVFAWLLTANASHDLGDAFQRIFVEGVNQNTATGPPLPTSGYRVAQEVDTSGPDASGKDIADIVLTGPRASIVVENYETADGHGHDFNRYLTHGALGGRRSVVVLLCARRATAHQRDGWQRAVVVTYAELLERLKAHIDSDDTWRKTHPRQDAFINELYSNFVEGARTVSTADRIDFIRAMCETGESARYGHRPQAAAAQSFADLIAQHARRQFEEGRQTLGSVKRALRSHTELTVIAQINERLTDGHIQSVQARYVGQWEWCITLLAADARVAANLVFGPTAVVVNDRIPEPLNTPDYTRIFATGPLDDAERIGTIVSTEVGLDEVLAGPDATDTRLRDALLAVIQAP